MLKMNETIKQKSISSYSPAFLAVDMKKECQLNLTEKKRESLLVLLQTGQLQEEWQNR